MLGARLEDLITAEKLTFEQISINLSDTEKQRELLQQDEEEDFLDECNSIM